MTVNFSPPSYRAGGSDLAISISPLGLVELADEEFEVHGPRLNRYALNWAFYLGHHWSYRREQGDAQVTVNFYRAFTDYIINFTFGRGVQFRSPKQTEHIVPDILKRVWEQHNDKPSVLWEMGQQGGISGDCFVKIAWDPDDTLPEGGRIRILALNSAYCFPEWHPHDRNRLIRFKMKYRFWGTSLEGTRQVYTYTEIITAGGYDNNGAWQPGVVEEYINDELIDQRENPFRDIPVVHIANTPVSGSPWGLPDCHDIVGLNKEYNEKATDISDIINYHAAPVTVIIGAKASNLEKGPKKVWGGLPKDARVENLELGAGLEGPLAFLEMLKRHMHELTGVPETALGQVQPISNTSGVALSIQFQPLMNRWQQKTVQYGAGIEKINAIVMQHVAQYIPSWLIWDPNEDDPVKDGQLPLLDPADPLTYETITHWPQPLPLDKLVKLNEIMLEMQLGLESRKGALRQLGEEFPDEKLFEIREELKDDAMADGELQLIQASIAAEIFELTGVMPGGDGDMQQQQTADQTESTTERTSDTGKSTTKTKKTPVPVGPRIQMDPAALMELQGEQSIRNRLVTGAYGTKLPQRRMPAKGSDD